jgi:lipopolysaccharide/colanic/teichoic acid biosynthesis glycosyltransferase
MDRTNWRAQRVRGADVGRGNAVSMARPDPRRSESLPGLAPKIDPARHQPELVALRGVDENRHRLYRNYGKAISDRVFGTALCIALLPIMAVIACLVRLRLGSPVFYLQQRVGLRGEPFLMYKFRTMKADRRQAELPPPTPDRRLRHKTPDDPRHTPFGMFLRKHSLDEFPQLWNVVKGDMSLVGPRPELPTVVAQYEPWQHARHLVKPGLTGLWQVSARNLGDGSLMYEHTDIDVEYLRQISLRTDLRIIRDTIRVLIHGSGGE